MNDEEVMQIGVCEECRDEVFDDNNEIYIDDEGNMFCSLECALLYHGIHKSEDCLVGVY